MSVQSEENIVGSDGHLQCMLGVVFGECAVHCEVGLIGATQQCRCASGCVVECRICNREVAGSYIAYNSFRENYYLYYGSHLGLGYLAPRSTQPSIPPGSVNEYQLRLGRQRQVYGSFRLRINVWVCR